MKRRSFIKKAGTAVILLSGGLPKLLIADESKSKGLVEKSVVSVVTNKNAVNSQGKINADIVKAMVEKVITLATNTNTTEESWAKIFPNYKNDEVIGLKVNATNRKLPTHPEVAYAIADSLIAAGVKPGNIMIFEKLSRSLEKTGYKINDDSKKGIRCFGHDHKQLGFDKKIKAKIPTLGLELNLSRIVTEICDYIINVPVLKNSTNESPSSGKAGVTLSLKNAYGYIPLADFPYVPPIEGLDPIEVIEKMHSNNGNPQIAELNLCPEIRVKTKFVILDGLLGLYEGGPFGPPQWINNQIMASTDLVAIDTVGMNTIDAKAKEVGKSLSSPFAKHIATASKLGLGNTDADKIDLKKYIFS
ncbi:MAG: DUF362 domain-containing protein [Candidatus Schekmanbacteria bacterium]|nr:MAG: DUF362 domain-containing protein [Candidatus Schekmanbacteria bacterium]